MYRVEHLKWTIYTSSFHTLKKKPLPLCIFLNWYKIDICCFPYSNSYRRFLVICIYKRRVIWPIGIACILEHKVELAFMWWLSTLSIIKRTKRFSVVIHVISHSIGIIKSQILLSLCRVFHQSETFSLICIREKVSIIVEL